MTDNASRSYRRIASLKSADEFASHITDLGLALDFDRRMMTGEGAPLQKP